LPENQSSTLFNYISLFVSIFIAVITGAISFIIATLRRDSKEIKNSLKDIDTKFRKDIVKLFDKCEDIGRHDERIKNLEKKINGS